MADLLWEKGTTVRNVLNETTGVLVDDVMEGAEHALVKLPDAGIENWPVVYLVGAATTPDTHRIRYVRGRPVKVETPLDRKREEDRLRALAVYEEKLSHQPEVNGRVYGKGWLQLGPLVIEWRGPSPDEEDPDWEITFDVGDEEHFVGVTEGYNDMTFSVTVFDRKSF